MMGISRHFETSILSTMIGLEKKKEEKLPAYFPRKWKRHKLTKWEG